MILAGETDELGRNKDLLCLQLSLLGTWWGVGDGALSLQLIFLRMSRASSAWSAVLVKPRGVVAQVVASFSSPPHPFSLRDTSVVITVLRTSSDLCRLVMAVLAAQTSQ